MTRKHTKAEAIGIVVRCAQTYKQELDGKNFHRYIIEGTLSLNMLNIQDYQRYSGEKKIALMDNSTVSFLEQVERAGISTKELLKDYDAILIPNWVSEEICDSQYRKNYIEGLHTAGLPINYGLYPK